ncbi:MAG: HepT-like ribonuclease domain-containing protein [Thermoleophilia bacterium]
MPRSTAAYLSDIIEACDAIHDVLAGVELAAYQETRAIRSAVEREFITIGEAISVLGRVAPEVVNGISHVRMIVGFRNVLTHDYAAVDDEAVLAVAQADVPVLRRECAVLLERTGEAD